MLRAIFIILGATLVTSSSSDAGTFYVSASGTNSSCFYNAPCQTIQQALNAAQPGDAIVCLSPPAQGGIRIVKSITIECTSARAVVEDYVADPSNCIICSGVLINVPANDPFGIVRLRGIIINGDPQASTARSTPYYDRGIDIQGAAAVYIEESVISNVNQQGIYDHRTGGQTALFVKDTIISGSGGAGILAASAGVAGTVLDNVNSERNAYGIAVAHGNNVSIRNSVFSGNSTAGVEGDAGAQVTVYNSTISHNNFGVQSVSSVRVFNNNIEFNNTAFNGQAATQGFNRYSSNGSIGTAPTPISGAPADIGP